MGGKRIKILLACEHQVVCLGIANFLVTNSKMSVVDQVSNLPDLYTTLRDNQIDIAMVELALLKSSGLSAIKDILKIAPGLKVIVLSRNEKEPFISKCIEFGALGYVSLKCEPDELFEATEKVFRNQRYLSQDVAYEFALANLDKNDQIFSSLTTREYQVFTQMAKGLSVADIADAMNLSPKTIHVYRSNIFGKLEVKSASELTILALKHGIISIDVID